MSVPAEPTHIYTPHGIGTMAIEPQSVFTVNILTAICVLFLIPGIVALVITMRHSTRNTTPDKAEQDTTPQVALVCAMLFLYLAVTTHGQIAKANTVAMEAQRQEIAPHVTIFLEDIGVDQDALCADSWYDHTLACHGVKDARGIATPDGEHIDIYNVRRFGRTVAVEAAPTTD